MDTTDLRNYLEKARLLECDLQTISIAKSKLRASKKEAPCYQKYSEPTEPTAIDDKEFPSWNPLDCLIIGIFPSLLNCGIAIITFFFARNMDFVPGIILVLISYLLASILIGSLDFNKHKSKHIAQQKSASEKYNAAMLKYKTELEQYNQAVATENSRYTQEVEQITFFNSGIDHQIHLLDQNYTQTRTTLNKFYELNIVYPKYRGLVPITRFCEYLDSGRRTCLTGVNGMYDLYESELAQGIIVGKLDLVNQNLTNITDVLLNISDQLDEVRYDQKLLFDAISSSNRTAERLCTNTNKMLEQMTFANSHFEKQDRQLEKISSATEMTALCTAMNARRTDAIANIAEFEYNLRH